MAKPKPEDFFSELVNDKPFLKAAIEGFAGSGKTFTASLLAIGLHRRIKSKKPVILFDTERAVGFLRGVYEKANVAVQVKSSRSLADLADTMEFMRGGISDILVIDSISHVWENFLEAYKRQRSGGGTFISFEDWGIIKPTWKAQYSDHFVNDHYHTIMCGRAGYEYDNELNETSGKRDLIKTGVKMKVETETPYEADLTILMERAEDLVGRKRDVWREAVIKKDRSQLLDGKVFRDPTYTDFAPVVDFILDSPAKVQSRGERDAADLIQSDEGRKKWIADKRQALEEIESYMVLVWPGQTKDEKQAKIQVLEEAFGTMSWTAIKRLPPEDLWKGLVEIWRIARRQIETLKPPKAIESRIDPKELEPPKQPEQPELPEHEQPINPVLRKQLTNMIAKKGWGPKEVDKILGGYGFTSPAEVTQEFYEDVFLEFSGIETAKK